MRRAALLPLLLSLAACSRSSDEASRGQGSAATGASPGAPAAPAQSGGLLPVGAAVPAISATAHNGESVKLDGFEGRPVVVYFYPKDGTPGCTVEAQGIRDEWEALKQTNAVVIGVSTDDAASHKAFAEKHSLPFLLLPDPDGEIAKGFGVPLKLGFAKRVTFVIDRHGKVAKVFSDVQPKGHAQEILAALRAM